MSYKVASTTSQGCECELFIRLWAIVCNYLGKGLINVFRGKKHSYSPDFFHAFS